VDTALLTRTQKLKQVLSQHGVSEDMKNSIISALLECHDHVSETFELFKTRWRVESYLQDNFHYIPPRTVKLGSGTFQYVSVAETVNKIRADKTFKSVKKPEQAVATEDGFLLRDIQDGLLFKENKFFKENPNALRK